MFPPPAVPVSTRIEEAGSLPILRGLVNDRALNRVSCHHLEVMVCFAVSCVVVVVGSTMTTEKDQAANKLENK